MKGRLTMRDKKMWHKTAGLEYARKTQNMESRKYRNMRWTVNDRCQSRFESTHKPYTSRNWASTLLKWEVGQWRIVLNVHGCLSVCLSVVRVCSGTTNVQASPNFLCTLPVAVAGSFSCTVAICYVFPILWLTSCFSIMDLTAAASLKSCARARTPVAWCWFIGCDLS